jgi:hypothetical protein
MRSARGRQDGDAVRDIGILEQGGRLGSGSPETRRSEAGQHELRPDWRGLVRMILGLANP